MSFVNPFSHCRVNKIADYFVDDAATGVNLDAIQDDIGV